jgi:hypothetical protein
MGCPLGRIVVVDGPSPLGVGETVFVVPCDEAAIKRAARRLAGAYGEEAGFVDWLRVAQTALRAAGETP